MRSWTQLGRQKSPLQQASNPFVTAEYGYGRFDKTARVRRFGTPNRPSLRPLGSAGLYREACRTAALVSVCLAR